MTDQPANNSPAAALARVGDVTRLSFGGKRKGLRKAIKQGDEGWKAPETKNGHHVEGLFEREPDDPITANEAVIFKRERMPSIEMTHVELLGMMRAAFRKQTESLQDWTQYRIQAAWRIVREMAAISGLVQEDEKLAEMPEMKPDPWLFGGSCPNPNASDPRTAQLWGAVERMTGRDGLPLLPPQVPAEFRDEYGVRSEYNPRNIDHDRRLHEYLELVSFISLTLHIVDGSSLDPEAGVKGMEGLEDPWIARIAWPSRLQIIAWEDHVVCEALDWLVEEGKEEARNRLQAKYGLQPHEVKRVLRLALAEAGARITNGSVEEERGLMVLKLEKIESRAVRDGQLKVALAASKQSAIVLGLNKVDPDDILKEFAEIVRDRARRRAAPALEEDIKKVPALVTNTKEDE